MSGVERVIMEKVAYSVSREVKDFVKCQNSAYSNAENPSYNMW